MFGGNSATQCSGAQNSRNTYPTTRKFEEVPWGFAEHDTHTHHPAESGEPHRFHRLEK